MRRCHPRPKTAGDQHLLGQNNDLNQAYKSSNGDGRAHNASISGITKVRDSLNQAAITMQQSHLSLQQQFAYNNTTEMTYTLHENAVLAYLLTQMPA